MYFKDRHYTPENDRNWRYGFVIGLKKAFDSRKGYELMTRALQKVLDVYHSLDRIQMHAD